MAPFPILDIGRERQVSLGIGPAWRSYGSSSSWTPCLYPLRPLKGRSLPSRLGGEVSLW